MPEKVPCALVAKDMAEGIVVLTWQRVTGFLIEEIEAGAKCDTAILFYPALPIEIRAERSLQAVELLPWLSCGIISFQFVTDTVRSTEFCNVFVTGLMTFRAGRFALLRFAVFRRTILGLSRLAKESDYAQREQIPENVPGWSGHFEIFLPGFML